MYPVHYHVDRPDQFDRLQLLIRVVAFCALGMIGLSFGMVMMFGFVALPAFAAIRLTTRSQADYVQRDGLRIANGLRWFAAISAWAGLITDRLPHETPSETLRVDLTPTAHPTPTTAIVRVLTGIPSAFVLALLGCLGVVVWVWAALSILFVRRVGPGAFAYLVGLQRWSIRLLAYQAALVDDYPPFTFEDVPDGSVSCAS